MNHPLHDAYKLAENPFSPLNEDNRKVKLQPIKDEFWFGIQEADLVRINEEMAGEK